MESFENTTVSLSGIVEDSIADGPGLRTAIFTQGCTHHCKGCHNAHTWPFEGGKKYSLSTLYSLIAENPLLGGVTFSGGEPFDQIEKLLPLIIKIKKDLRLEIAIYTGYSYEQLLAMNNPIIMETLANIDTLVDGAFLLEQRNLNNKYKGSDNQRIIDIQKSLQSGAITLDITNRWN